MHLPRRRRTKTPTTTPAAKPADTSTDVQDRAEHLPGSAEDDFDPETARDLCFELLAKRLGAEGAKAMRADFDDHLEKDGIEQAYVCLFGKMVTAIDRAMEIIMTGTVSDDGPAKDSTGVSGFDAFR